MKDNLNRKDPRVKDVLTLLGAGAFLAGSILIPSLPKIAQPLLQTEEKDEKYTWKQFNTWRLRQVLKRMHGQKMVEISETAEGHIVRITKEGRKKLLKYDLETLTLVPHAWDGKWRIIIYDVQDHQRASRDIFRNTLRKLKFFQLQKSVYLTPYRCEDEIEYLRQICGIGTEVIRLTVSGLENEQAYKEYFGLS